MPIVALTQGRGHRLYSPLPQSPGIFLTYGPDAFREATTHHDGFGKFPLTGQLYAKRSTDGRTRPLQHFLTGLFGVNGEEHRRQRRLLIQMRRIVQQKRATGPGTTDVLSILLQAEDADTGTSLTENEVLGHVGVLFAAGHETSANAVTWTLFLLGQHPEVAAQLVDELDGVLRGADPGAADLGRLPLMEYVVKEAMRVLPPVPWNARVLLWTAEVGGYQLPAGAEVWISIFETHRCPALFPEPAKFRPSRWESLDLGPFEYVPFSAGPRMCIGAGFAMMEIRLILAMVLKRFRLEMAEGACLDRAGIVVLAPKNGLPMKIYPQDRRFGDGAAKVRGNIGELVELPS
jgi:cytochrome P450